MKLKGIYGYDFNMNFKYFSYLVQVFSVIMLLLVLLLVYKITSIKDDIIKSEANRVQSISLAYQLLQSSEDLTRMARTYVSTGNLKYKQIYFNVFGIRNGTLPRPKDYIAAYWHLNLLDEASVYDDKLQAVSLKSLMQTAQFTDVEMNYLKMSQENSDVLVLIEKKAFESLKNKYLEGDELHKQRDYAIDLLYNSSYVKAKKGIMMPIKQAINSINARTTKELESYHISCNWYIDQIWILIIGAIFSVFCVFIYTHKQYVNPLQKLSNIDPLTGLLNRRRFTELAEQELIRAKRTKRLPSLLMIDIDFFKKINDTYGHDIGDKVIIELSDICRETMRDIDILCRWGGEEFLILLLETDVDAGFVVAERLRKSIETFSLSVHNKAPIQFTVSIGLATLKSDSDSLSDIIKSSDELLYQAKNTGRNKVCRG